jgi:hypothetical protein
VIEGFRVGGGTTSLEGAKVGLAVTTEGLRVGVAVPSTLGLRVGLTVPV